jgi:DNA-binding transcriptional MocR family regulator
MSYRILGKIIENAILPANQKLVLIVLANFHNDELQKAWPSQETLCRLTGLSRATINRALKELKDKGHISIWKERTSGQYAHSVYRINHVSERHMVEEVGLKSEQTMYQKGGSPCRTVRHHPLRTLNKPLKENSKKIRRNSRLPESVEEFRELPPLLQEHYWFHKPEMQRMLRHAGCSDLASARKP